MFYDKYNFTFTDMQLLCDDYNPDYWIVKELIFSKRKMVNLICKQCKKEQTKLITDIKRKIGCSTCNAHLRKDLSFYIRKSKQIFGNKYDYSQYVYINSDIKGIIICKDCGNKLNLTMHSHINGKIGCKMCHLAKMNDNVLGKFLYTKKNVFVVANALHNGIYTYKTFNYINAITKGEVLCTLCNSFFNVTMANHINNKSGCPTCNGSYGEKILFRIFKELNVNIERQKTFTNCVNKRKLRFDFYLVDYDCLLEYNGLQHYEFVQFFHKNKKQFENQQLRDKLKNEFCVRNNIKYIVLDGRSCNDYLSIKQKLMEVIDELQTICIR